MMDRIDSVGALEQVVGKMPATMHLKVIDHLDEGARRWIAAAPLMFAGFGDAWRTGVTLGGGPIGFAEGDARTLRLPAAWLDDPAAIQQGMAFGSLFLIPGIGETLRVNGRVTSAGPDEILVSVEECYGHCAKALIRSALWSADLVAEGPGDAASFIAASRFIALATLGVDRCADLSPKGDPAGCMARLDDGVLWFADRPGNRRVDSFRNILTHPHVALAVLIPGANRAAIVQGIARLTTDETVRAGFTVQGRTPPLAIGVEITRLTLRTSAALTRAHLWPVTTQASGIEPSEVFTEHVRLNRTRGVVARLARAALAVPGVQSVLRKGLDKDYRDNLY